MIVAETNKPTRNPLIVLSTRNQTPRPTSPKLAPNSPERVQDSFVLAHEMPRNPAKRRTMCGHVLDVLSASFVHGDPKAGPSGFVMESG